LFDGKPKTHGTFTPKAELSAAPWKSFRRMVYSRLFPHLRHQILFLLGTKPIPSEVI
jgi:hypothetical protein